MKNALLLFSISLFMVGCEKNADRFEDLQRLSGSRFFVREIPTDLKEGVSISFGYIENSGEIQYLGDFLPAQDSDHVDLYFFSDPLRLGWVSGSKSGIFPITLHKAGDFSTTFFGEEKGDLSDPILRLSNARNPMEEPEHIERNIEFILYEAPTN
jgi:hypothetical protein